MAYIVGSSEDDELTASLVKALEHPRLRQTIQQLVERRTSAIGAQVDQLSARLDDVVKSVAPSVVGRNTISLPRRRP
jgi:hypothetical protein